MGARVENWDRGMKESRLLPYLDASFSHYRNPFINAKIIWKRPTNDDRLTKICAISMQILIWNEFTFLQRCFAPFRSRVRSLRRRWWFGRPPRPPPCRWTSPTTARTSPPPSSPSPTSSRSATRSSSSSPSSSSSERRIHSEISVRSRFPGFASPR